MRERQVRRHKLSRKRIWIAAAVLGLWAALFVAFEAFAAQNFIVDDTTDLVDASPGDGECRTNAGTCTLRAAIQEANAFAGADIITVPAGTYAITLAGAVVPPEPPEADPLAVCTQTVADAHEGDFDITCPVTINGAGAGTTVIDAAGLGRVIEVHAGAGAVLVSGVTVTDGLAAEDGGGIFSASAGALTLNGVTVTGNETTSDGGGIYTTSGTLNVGAGSVISDNTARNGGGIFNAGELSETGVPSAVKLTGATVSGNTAIEGGGGGIFNDHEGALTLTDTTVEGNFAEDSGGGISVTSKSSLTMTGGQIVGNSAHGDGGGLFASAERTIFMSGVTVEDNHAGVPTPLEAGEGHGGGLSAGGDGSLEILDSTFRANTAAHEGGGIYLDNNGSVAITDTVVTENHAGTGGGGIENAATVVTLTRLEITDNVAELDGGGIESQGSGAFTIADTSIIGNRAENGGGFANAADGTTHVIRTTLFDNAALTGLNDDTGLGGGIYSLGDADAVYENVTISGNLAQVRGGGFYADADADIKVTNATISRNSAPIASGVGGEIGSINFPIQPSLSVVFKNTIVAGNLLGPNCTFAIGSQGGNMDDGDTCMFRGLKDRVNVDPADIGLDAIADNGGPTMTMALQPQSLAIDGGVGPCSLTDQRGVSRPQNGVCDMGAYEYEGPFPPPDELAPTAEILGGPVQDTESTSAFTFTGNDDITPVEHLLFECRLIEEEIGEPPEPPDPTEPPEPEFAFVGCGIPVPGSPGVFSWQVQLIEDGLYTLEVRAIDRADNVGEPDVLTFGGVLDTSAPQTFFIETPPNPSSSNSAVFTFGADDGPNGTPEQFMEFECRLDTLEPEAWLECTNPAVFSNLTVGSHTFQVRATDGADNIDPSPATYTWIVGTPFNCDEANITLVANADVYVDQESPAENFVVTPELVVRSGDLATNARTLIRFPVSNDAPDCELESATLRLYAGSGEQGRNLQAIPLASSWAENTATWNNQPGTAGAAITTTSGTGYREWDVTGHVRSMLDGTLTNNGWLIRDAIENDPEGAEQGFLSRETPQDPPPTTLPQLELKFADAGIDPPAPPTAGDPYTAACGDVITESIVLQNDLLGCLGEGLVIGASDIEVDLNGHTISSGVPIELGEEDGLLAGIRNAGHDNVVIKNGTVRNFGYGVRIMGNAIFNIVEDMTLDANVVAGVELFDADNGRDGNTIRNNLFTANGEGAVALIAGSEGSVVTGNTFIGNGGVAIFIQESHGNTIGGNEISGLIIDPLIDSDGGIFLEAATDNVIVGNTVSDAGDAGIFLFSGSHDNVIEDNIVSRSSDSGIEISDSDGNQVIDNVAHLNGGSGIGLSNANNGVVIGNDARFNPGGIELAGSNGNLIENNDVSNAQGNGITVEGGLLNQIRNNTADNTDATGIAIEAEAVDTQGNPIPGNVIEGNSANGNLGDGISVSAGGHTVTANVAHNNAGFGITAGEFVIDGGGNEASGNGEPAQCVGVVCAAGTPPAGSGPDIEAPETVVDSGPANGGSTLDPQVFTFSATDNIAPATALRFECRLDAPPDPEPEPPEPPEPGEPPEPPEPVDVANWHECGSPWMYQLLLAGEHTFEVRATDPSENVDLTPASYTWTLVAAPPGPDSTPPNTTIFATPEDPSITTEATFEFRGSDNQTPGPNLTFECRLDSTDEADFAPCTSPVTYSGLALGSHTFEVRAVDFQGNLDATPDAFTWTIEEPPPDVIAPETSIDSAPDLTTVDTTASFEFSSDEDDVTFECRIDGVDPWTACTSPQTYTGLSVATHNFEVRATDAAGNTGDPASFTWTIAAAPVEIQVGCGQVINQSVVLLNSLVDCPGDGLIVGAHGITIDLGGQTIDGTGAGLSAGIRNNGFDSVTITNGIVQEFESGVLLGSGTAFGIVDMVTSQLNVLAGVQLSNADAGGIGNTIRHSIVAGSAGDGILVVNGTQHALIHDNVVSGSSGYGIHVLNSNGNTFEANQLSASADVSVLLEAADGNLLIGNEVVSGGDSGIMLTVGSTANRVEGNIVTESEAGVNVLDSNENEIVDNIAQANGDAGIILENAHESTVSGNDVRFNSTGVELMGSSNNLIAENNASQSDGAGISLEDTSLSNTIRLNTANGNSAGGIYIGDFAPGGSGNLIDRNTASSNTGDGIHVGDVGHIIVGNVADNNEGWGIYAAIGTTAGVNVDGGGNTASGNSGGILDPVTGLLSQCFNVVCDGGDPLPTDLLPPETTITAAPSDPTSFVDATFQFTGTDNATPVTFECRLDGTDPWVACSSAQTYVGLPLGDHTFEVRALDFSGNVDPTPASYTWTIEEAPPGVPPTISIDSGPDATTASPSATFTLSSNEPGVTFGCALDGATFSDCDSPVTYDGLAVGTHQFVAQAVDGEGLIAVSDPYNWTITAAPTEAAVTCGQVLNQSTLVTNDLTDCPGPGLVIGAHAITVDLGGHVIDGLGQGIGILNNGFDSVTVTNGTVQEFDVGLQLNPGSTLNIVDGLTLQTNELAGVELVDADNNQIRDNVATLNGSGVRLAGGTQGALVTGNTITENFTGGIVLEAASGNTISGNTLSGNDDAGISVGVEGFPSNNNLITANEITTSGGAGVAIVESSGNQVEGNVISQSNDVGISLENANDNDVVGNDARSNPGGISLSDSNDNLIQSNNTGASSGTGISVEGLSFGNSIVGNTSSGNSGAGIEVAGVAPTGQGNLVDGNMTSNNSGEGISVTGSGHTVSNNTANQNDGWGIFVEPGNVDGGGNAASGNAEPTQCSGVVCTIGPAAGAPDTELVDMPPNPSNSRNALFTFIGTDDTTALIDLEFQCRLDSTDELAFVECENPQEYFELSAGEHTFDVRAVDLQENVDPTPASYTWEYVPLPSGVAPDTFIDFAPPLETNLFEGVFTFSSNEPDVSFECSLDGEPFSPCEFAYEFEMVETAVGEHTFQVRAIDFEGNTDPTPATHTWTILGVIATITDGPAFIAPTEPGEPAEGGETDQTTATITFEANLADSTFVCSLDLQTFENCASPVTYTDLAVGEHLFRVIATGPEGELQLEATEYGWTVIPSTDVTPPDTTITVAPADGSSDTVFEFTGTDDQTQPLALEFECRLDSTDELAWVECISPFNLLVEFPELGAGPHTFEVRAIDGAEPEPNVDPTPATYAWDATADVTTPVITTLTAATATDPSLLDGESTDLVDVELAFDGTDNATPLLQLVFECSVDGGPFEECSSPASVQVEGSGTHTFEVRAVDLAGNLGDATSLGWNLVNTPVGTDVSVELVTPAGLATITFANITAFGETTIETLAAPPDLPAGFDDGSAIFFDISSDATYTGPIEVCLGYDPAGFADPTLVALIHYDGTTPINVTTSNDPVEGVVCGVVDSLSPFAIAEPDPGDVAAPQTSIDSGPDDPTFSTTADFVFSSSEPLSTFTCSVDGGGPEPCQSPLQLIDLGLGEHTLAVAATDPSGNVDPTPASYTWTIEGPPTTTITSAPSEIIESTAVTFEFEGSSAGLEFECWLDGPVGPCSSPVTYTGLALGEHIFAVRALVPAGVPEPEWEDHEFTIVSPLPPTTNFEVGGVPPGSTTDNTATFMFTGTDNATVPADLVFNCMLNGIIYMPCMSPVELTDLTLGTHTFEVSAVDEIGQSDPTPATYTWTVVEPAPVDTMAPETMIVSSPEVTTTLAHATFTFSANETGATFECRLDSTLETDWETDCVSPYLATDLELGPHTFEVRATDLAGNTDATPATHTWTIEADIVAPDTTIISGPSGTNAALDVVFTFTGSDESTDVLELEFECRLDGTDPADWGDCSSPHEIQGLASGEHLFEVRAIDQAGNVDPTPDTRSWTTVDITAPETSIETGPTDPTEATMATFTFSSDEPDSTFECSFDGAGFSNCTSPHELTGVDVGLHTFEVRAVDPAGNTDGTPELYEWTVVSADPPDTTIDSGPVDGTELTTALFLFSSDQAGVAFECALDGEAFSECESPHELDGLSVGTHELMVRAVNAADQVDPTPATYAWTVDAPDPPETTIVLAPPSSTTATSATFTFGSDVLDAGFECSLDGAAFESCESPVEYQGLVFGPHTFEVVATDSTGLADPTPAIHSWVIETPPPACNGSTVTLTANFDAWIDQGSPSSNKGDDSILKVMSKSGANLRALVGFPFPALPDGCIVESAQLTMYAASSASGRTIQALPIAGSWTESGVTWNNQPGTTGTAATTASASGIRTWDVTSQVQVMYDSSALHGFLIRDAVESQDHEQQFHATEKNENPPRIVVTFGPAPEPDTTPPETSTPTGPESPTTSTSATFDLGGTDNETSSYNLSYECSLDGSGFEPCDSPVTYNGLAVGDHTFVVLAVDEAGNADASPEAYQWTIGSPPADTEAPDTAIESGPEATTTATDATFTFSSSETDATFECSLDGAPYAVCASPTDVAGMTIGVHLLEVRAIDSAGNTDASPASYSWAVEPVPSCVPATVVAGADADSWILQDSSRQNYGTDSVLKVDSKNNANARALVRFALPAIPEGCQIQSATLRLYAGSYKDGRTLTATRISASWSESNVTWSNRPGTGGPSATTSSGSGWREWSVTSQVQAMYSGSNRGFMIADANENGGGFDQGLHSREKGTDNPPSLELVFG